MYVTWWLRTDRSQSVKIEGVRMVNKIALVMFRCADDSTGEMDRHTFLEHYTAIPIRI